MLWHRLVLATLLWASAWGELVGSPPNCERYIWEPNEPVPPQIRDCVTFRTAVIISGSPFRNVSFLAQLQSADTIKIENSTNLLSVDFPALRTAGWVIGINLNNNQQLARFYAPLLEKATVHLLDLPKLATVSVPLLEESSVRIDRTGASTLSFPALKRSGGILNLYFYIWNNPQLTSIDAPQLSDSGRVEFGENHLLTQVSVPALQTAWTFVVLKNIVLESVSAPSLLTIGKDEFLGWITFGYNYQLRSISMPLLQYSRSFEVMDDVSELSFPALARCQEDFSIRGPATYTRLEHLGFDSLDLTTYTGNIRLLVHGVCCSEVKAWVTRVHAVDRVSELACKEGC